MNMLADRPMNECSSCLFRHGETYLEGTGYVISRQGPRPTYEMCDEMNRLAGIEETDWQNLRYPETGMEPLRLILVEDGRIFREVEGREKVLEEDPMVVREVLRQRDEDRETQKARIALAEELAEEWGGSRMARTLFHTAIWFCNGHPGEGSEHEEGTFWMVGRNASHQFYMGMRREGDEVKFLRGWYESEWEDREGNVQGGWESSEVEAFQGYYGHC